MIPRAGACLGLALVAALHGPAAHAYRPFDGTDASVADSGEFELELGPVQRLREGSQRSWVAPAVVANWGLAHDREVVLEGKVRRLQGDSVQEARTSVADAAVSLKQVHRRGSLQDEAGPSVASECGVLLPDSHSDSHAGFTCAAIVSQRFPLATLHFNAALSRTRERRTGRFVSLIAEGATPGAVRPVMELMREDDGSDTTRSVLVGAIWRRRDDLSFDVGLRVGRSGAGSVHEVRAGLTWSYSAP